MNNKKTPLDQFEDAFIDSVLNMSESELDEELREMELDPEAAITRTKAAIARGIIKANKANFARTRSQLADAKARLASSSKLGDRSGAVARFEKLKTGDPDLSNRMMMAARKGKGLSENDVEAILEDLDDLEKLKKGDDGK
ncbi:hypothetical protein [Methylosinus sp. RM1]|uniref:hypothetical protein n=1 Tax=Methylosinus sp. RM1 TaxID=2583817 RepID=UPI00140AAFA7|nr:hypothetical protein [Methylosinus sp. RM1]